MACLLMNSAHHHSTPNLMSNGNSGNGNTKGGGERLNHHHSNNVTGSSSVHDTLASIVVPNELKTLLRLIMRIFYSFELYLCIEMLLIYPCLKEEDLAELLRLDLKTVQQYLVNLKKEKFLNERSIMETSADGKQSRHRYYHINFNMVVNVIKYKLDRIRIQIENDENQSTTRPQFKCSECGKTYSDLDTKDIFLTMRCTLCNAEVEEDTSALPKQTSRNLMSKFNIQMTPIFDLLHRVEHVRLADSVQKPEPVDLSHVLERMKASSSSASAAGQNGLGGKAGGMGLGGKAATKSGDAWSGDKTRFNNNQSMTSVNLNTGDGSNSAEKRVTKELPSIISQNRVRDEENDNRDSMLLNSVRQAADETINNTVVAAAAATAADSSSNSGFAKPGQPASSGLIGLTTSLLNGTTTTQADSPTTQSSQPQNLEVVIMQKLLKHEKKASGQATNGQPDSPDSSSTSNSPKTLPDPVSSIMITKKRTVMDTTDGFKSSSSTGFYHSNVPSRSHFDENDVYAKKRKLNNGDILNHSHVSSVYFKRNHSDGSGSENGSDDYTSGADDTESDYSSIYVNNNVVPDDADQDDEYIPRVYVQNRPIRFDRISPRHIKQMTQSERDDYINICKQLYTEIYEI